MLFLFGVVPFNIIKETLVVADGDTNKKRLVAEGQLVNVKYGKKYFLARYETVLY